MEAMIVTKFGQIINPCCETLKEAVSRSIEIDLVACESNPIGIGVRVTNFEETAEGKKATCCLFKYCPFCGVKLGEFMWDKT